VKGVWGQLLDHIPRIKNTFHQNIFPGRNSVTEDANLQNAQICKISCAHRKSHTDKELSLD